MLVKKRVNRLLTILGKKIKNNRQHAASSVSYVMNLGDSS